MSPLDIEGRTVGDGVEPLIITEIGINHEGDIDKAKLMVDDAAESGAEMVKFQMHVIEDEMIDTDIVPENADETITDIMERCSLTTEEHQELKEYVEERGMTYLCTPFSRAAADILAEMDVEAFKIGSGECNNYPLVEHIASFGKPVILSTGMNKIPDIERSVEILEEAGVAYALLQCTSLYPTPYEKVNLGGMDDLREHFPDAVIGLSDHSQGIYVPLAAIAKGASIIEKHFTSSRDWPGPDVPVSINPQELKELIEGSEAVHKALGGEKTVVEGEGKTAEFAYASVVSTTSISEGEELSSDNIWVKRPGTGEIQADEYYKILGSTASTDIPEGTQIEWGMIDE